MPVSSTRWGRWTRSALDTIERYRLHLRLLFATAPGWCVLTLGLVCVGAATTIAMTIAVGRVVGAVPAAVRDGLDSAATSSLWRWFGVFTLAQVLSQVAGPLQGYVANLIAARHTARTLDLIAETGMAPHGISHLDQPEQATRLRTLLTETRGWQFVAQGTQAGWGILGTRLLAVGIFAVLAGWRWWVALLVAIAYRLLSRAFSAWVETIFARELGSAAAETRRAEYVRTLMTSQTAAKELRLFGMTDWLAERHHRLWLIAHQLTWSRTDRAVRPMLTAAVGLTVALGGAFVLLAHDAWVGRIDLATMLVLAGALLQMHAFGFVGDGQIAIAKVTTIVQELARLRVSLGLPGLQPTVITTGAPADAQPPMAATVDAQPPTAATIDLDEVVFSYPTRDRPTLDRLSLHIPAGQSVAVVGVNGAGKSTLIKLLAGLYPLDSGAVRIDGADPAASVDARRRVAVIFQDFVRYPFSLRDNVGFGARRSEQPVLDRALTDAGGRELLDRLEHGWDTVLSAEYEGGTDLSGGQWQRVALARALAAVDAGAGVLVLDEPTAALDVRAEAELFDRFLAVTRRVTTILVSHRLSSVRHADRIVVLDGGTGRISEDGSHDELMRTGGRYAELFTLQARRFAQAGPAPDPHSSES